MTRAGVASLVASDIVLPTKRKNTKKPAKAVVDEWPAAETTVAGPADPASYQPSTIQHSDEIVAKNRMLILQLEQKGVLAPDVVTISSSGQLQANLSVEPDSGTMAGLYSNLPACPNIDEQIPSWLRDHLVRELNVLGRGPPKACEALYEGLKRSQEEVGINTSIWVTEMQLACAVTSLQHSIEDIQEFVCSEFVVEDTYEREFGMVVRTVLRLVGSDGDKMPRDVQLLIDVGSIGVTMKYALEEPLARLVIKPYSQLAQKLEVVAKALRQDLERTRQQKDEAINDGDTKSATDSGVDICEFDSVRCSGDEFVFNFKEES